MGKELGEVFCSICGISSNDDNGNFHKKAKLCNRHWLQIKKYGKPTGNDRISAGSKKDHCEICGDKESVKYYVWSKPGDYYGKTVCNKHYTQLIRHNYLLDNTPSEHNEKNIWTQDEKNLLEQYYKDGLSFENISKLMNRTVSSISAMSGELKMGEKYMRSNNPNFKAIYQDYDWCYERYINRNMSFQEMADECGASLRVIQKWCAEVHRIHNNSFKYLKELNELQYQLILFGTLGDGHIDARVDQPMYIESHSETEKDYLYWKYGILQSICNKEPTRYKEDYSSFSGNKEYLCKPFYRLNTKIINELKFIRDMHRIDKIKMLNEFGLSLHTLDDGCRTNLWEVCLAEWTDDEIVAYINICKNNFGLECIRKSDERYVYFTAISSIKIDEIILKNIPNELDIIHKKILDNKSIKPLQHCRYVISNNKKIGLATFCKDRHLKYEDSKLIFDSFNTEYVDENEFLNKVG